MKDVPENVTMASTVSGGLINVASYSSVTVYEVDADSESEDPYRTGLKALSSGDSKFPGCHATSDADWAGGAFAATKVSSDVGPSYGDRTIAMG